VRVRAIVEDTAAQTALAAIEGGDGIHEHIIDAPDADYLAAAAIGQADLDSFAAETGLLQAEWDTQDVNAFPGARQPAVITGTTDDLNVTLTIESVEITFPVKNGLPHRHCTAADVKLADISIMSGPLVE